jgi:hypothetical protein
MRTKSLLLLSIIFAVLQTTYSQINMNSSGKVGIGMSPSGYRLAIDYSGLYIQNNGVYPGIVIDQGPGGSNYGLALFPTSNNTGIIGIPNKYFYYVYSYNYSSPSDIRFKENIRDIQNPLALILKMKGVRFDYKKENYYNDTIIKSPVARAKLEKERKNKVGFIAEDLNKILPEVVTHDDSTDTYGIDYSKVVPVLVEAIKMQQLQIDSIKQIIKKNTGSLKSAKDSIQIENISNLSDNPYLEQNVPNPFSVATSINFYIPLDNQKAEIFIYNMQGLQKEAYVINSKGKSSITINGSELQAGMYLYTLIVDGKEVDTKKMILTE